ncbi:LysR substrate-binding domain-containing protein, partial [Pseudomonas putida]|uniref:LysR substrate-binding domain-containing protein n=2 Tax=Pseudomonas TaxID=286 RepID=UPI002181EF6D
LPVLGAAEADRLVHFRLFGPHGKQQEIALEPRLAIDDFVVRNAAVRAGLGFTALPSMFCEEELARGELVRLLPDWSLPGGYLQAVYPHRRGLLPAVRVWIDHLAASFEACGERYV